MTRNKFALVKWIFQKNNYILSSYKIKHVEFAKVRTIFICENRKRKN